MRDARSTNDDGTGERRPRRRAARRGFTLVELLAVIAVIGILISILIPVTGGVIKSSRKAKTKVQFAQWAAAIEGFRQEYGYYPNFPTNLVNDPTRLFRELLSGRGTGSGTPPEFLSSEKPSSPSTIQNKKRVSFVSFGHSEIVDEDIVDAFGRDEIAVLVDKDYDGIIPAADFINLPSGPNLTPPPAGVRAGVIFYSAGAGESEADIVKSWE